MPGGAKNVTLSICSILLLELVLKTKISLDLFKSSIIDRCKPNITKKTSTMMKTALFFFKSVFLLSKMIHSKHVFFVHQFLQFFCNHPLPPKWRPRRCSPGSRGARLFAGRVDRFKLCKGPGGDRFSKSSRCNMVQLMFHFLVFFWDFSSLDQYMNHLSTEPGYIFLILVAYLNLGSWIKSPWNGLWIFETRYQNVSNIKALGAFGHCPEHTLQTGVVLKCFPPRFTKKAPYWRTKFTCLHIRFCTCLSQLLCIPTFQTFSEVNQSHEIHDDHLGRSLCRTWWLLHQKWCDMSIHVFCSWHDILCLQHFILLISSQLWLDKSNLFSATETSANASCWESLS